MTIAEKTCPDCGRYFMDALGNMKYCTECSIRQGEGKCMAHDLNRSTRQLVRLSKKLAALRGKEESQ